MEDLDQASIHEERYASTLIKLHGDRHKPRAEYNEQGAKICLECGEVVPPLRAAIAWVTTCVPCQQQLENKK